MQNVQPSLFARDHTFLGVCEGLGEDLGFNPLYLRMTLPVPLFFYPAETLVGYLAAGVVILVSRLLFPNPRPAPALHAVAVEAAAEHGPLQANDKADPDPVLLAA